VTSTPVEQHDTVLVVDFGAQYAQLIARRVREARVYSEIVPSSMSADELLAKGPAAIILSGGPSSVYEPGAPQLDPAIVSAGVPAFGICYGFQAMALALGGRVAQTGQSEFGRTPLTVTSSGALFAGLPVDLPVWMSHGDSVSVAPDGCLAAVTTGTQASSRLASFVGANALLVVPPREVPFQAGERVEAILLGAPGAASVASDGQVGTDGMGNG